MKLNQATDYAFRMVLHMAMLPSGTKITGAVLAEQELHDQMKDKLSVKEYEDPFKGSK